MAALKARLDETRDGLSIQSTLTEAINYTLNHWAGLILFLDDGRLEPDTNIVRSVRSVRLAIETPQLSYFAATRRPGVKTLGKLCRRSLPTAKLNEIDPETYLTDVLERIVSGRTKINQLDELLVLDLESRARGRSHEDGGVTETLFTYDEADVILRRRWP